MSNPLSYTLPVTVESEGKVWSVCIGPRLSQCVSEIWWFEVFKMAAGRHLQFDPTGNGAIRSAVLENPTLARTSLSDDVLLSYGHLKFFAKCVNGP